MKIIPRVNATMISALLLFSACQQEKKSDGYGQFEATEVTISSKTGGELIHFPVEESDKLSQGTRTGLIDTVMTALQIDEVRESIRSIRAQIESIEAQIEVTREELKLAETNLARIKRMYENGAATEQQLDDAQSRVSVLKKRITSQQAEKRRVGTEVGRMQVKILQLRRQIEDSQIINPVDGTVLSSFVERYEVVAPGQPLYRIANLDTLTLRVYVSGAQLPDIKLGQQVTVLVDKNREENKSMPGRIKWIASEAEFTPQMIQTKEERVTQVYAVEIEVPNPEGVLKIGMPGEMVLNSGKSQQ